MKNKIISTVIALLLLFVSVPQIHAADELTGHFFEKDMRALISKGIMKGDEKGKYNPDNAVTRAEFAAFIVRVLEPEDVQQQGFSMASLSEKNFSDVKMTDWFYEDVYKAAELGVVNGTPDGKFLPKEIISRQDMAVMVNNAIKSKGIISEKAPLTFKDTKQIQSYATEAVQRVLYLEVMLGKGEGLFGPKDPTTRGQTAAVLNRIMNLMEPPKTAEYQVATLNADGTPNILKEYETFETAKANLVDNQVILKGNNIIYMKNGIAAANSFTIIHNKVDLSDSGRTYVNTGTEFKFLDATTQSVKIELAGTVGYVSQDKVNLVPSSFSKERSYYTKSGKDLYHTVYNPITKKYGPATLIGLAPSFMSENEKYYSWDGINYTNVSGTQVGEAYTYLINLPLHRKTTYTAEDLDRYLQENFPKTYPGFTESPLVGTGKDFKEMEEKYEINALYLMSHAIHESAWGTSRIAVDKKNLFGMKAYDGDPYESATKYNSFRESIEEAAAYVSKSYHAPKGTYYHGAVLGNKSVGMNVKYASDPYWGERIAGHMYRADKYLGGNENNKYPLAVGNIESLNVRTGYGTNNPLIYEMKISGIPFIYTAEEVQPDGSTWYKIISDDKANRNGHVYGNGSLGLYVKKAPLAQ